jgi:hypothetical protein
MHAMSRLVLLKDRDGLVQVTGIPSECSD